MGSLLRRSLLLSINNIKNNKKIWISKRLQQTNAAFNSTNETQQQSSNNVTPIFRNAIKYGDKIALKDLQGDYTYRGLYLSSRQFSLELSSILNGHEQERISFLMPNDASYVIVQWACWMSGHIAVPLNTSSPQLLLDYYINDSDSKLIITTKENLPIIEPLLKNTNRKLIIFDDTLRLLAQQPDNKITNNKLKIQLPPSPSTTTATINNNKKFIDTQYDDSYYNDKIAMFVYTSGTTGKPKGVVMTFKNIQSQINSLINAWKWNDKDIILHTLPLNHIHGIINVLMCPLTIGAKCILLPKFQTSSVWSYLLAINMQNNDRCNIFMAVPTIYMKLIHEYDQLFTKNNKIKDYVYNVCSTRIRLMVSGSAPLPKPIFDRWEEITGHRLLERYGMTETGMVLSNPLEGQRIPGTHGTPLPGVEVRITKNNKNNNNNDSDVLVQGTWHGSRILTNEKGVLSGELQVKGDNVFREYWNKPDETKKEFTKDGWFKTGDTVQYDNRIYSILGRSSVDIIKTGGFKVSALQVETAILGHPDIIDCAVVGLPDITWGQKVAAVVVAREGTEIILSQLREFGKKLLPEYAVPTVLKVVDKIPKNNMGKVNKPNLLAEVFPKNQI